MSLINKKVKLDSIFRFQSKAEFQGEPIFEAIELQITYKDMEKFFEKGKEITEKSEQLQKKIFKRLKKDKPKEVRENDITEGTILMHSNLFTKKEVDDLVDVTLPIPVSEKMMQTILDINDINLLKLKEELQESFPAQADNLYNNFIMDLEKAFVEFKDMKDDKEDDVTP